MDENVMGNEKMMSDADAINDIEDGLEDGIGVEDFFDEIDDEGLCGKWKCNFRNSGNSGKMFGIIGGIFVVAMMVMGIVGICMAIKK